MTTRRGFLGLLAVVPVAVKTALANAGRRKPPLPPQVIDSKPTSTRNAGAKLTDAFAEKMFGDSEWLRPAWAKVYEVCETCGGGGEVGVPADNLPDELFGTMDCPACSGTGCGEWVKANAGLMRHPGGATGSYIDDDGAWRQSPPARLPIAFPVTFAIDVGPMPAPPIGKDFLAVRRIEVFNSKDRELYWFDGKDRHNRKVVRPGDSLSWEVTIAA
jgi:hypothetical protein